jgi:hypothetical protein
VTYVRKGQILFLLGTLCVLAFHLGVLFRPGGLSDGGFY